MKTIYDCFSETDDFFAEVNQMVLDEHPEYIEQYGEIGSHNWRAKAHNNELPQTEYSGEVVNIGTVEDSDGSLVDILELETDKCSVSYERVDFWAHPEIKIGSIISIESFVVADKDPENEFYFEKRVQIK